MDDLDRAQEIEMESRNAAISNQMKKQGKNTLSHCQDCGDVIPPKRQKLGGIIRCIECQQLLEIKQKRGLAL